MKTKLTYLLTIIILILGLSFSARQCSNYKHNLVMLERTYEDSMASWRLKDSSQVIQIEAYSFNLSTLKKVNQDLYKEIEELRLKKTVQTVTKYKTQIVYHNDTTYIVDSINNGFNHQFNFNDKWRKLEGNLNYSNDSLNINIDNEVYADYTVALDKDNKIYIHTDNPYVKLTEISGWTKPKERTKRWGIGPAINIGYSIRENKPDVSVGVGIQYNLIRW